MKARRNKYYKISLDPYAAELTVILSENPDKIKNKLCDQDNDVHHGTENSFFLYDKPDSKKYVIIFSHTPNIDCIAHECFHLVYKILETSGSKLNHSTEEQYAYLLGHVVGSVTDKIIKHSYKKRL